MAEFSVEPACRRGGASVSSNCILMTVSDNFHYPEWRGCGCESNLDLMFNRNHCKGRLKDSLYMRVLCYCGLCCINL